MDLWVWFLFLSQKACGSPLCCLLTCVVPLLIRSFFFSFKTADGQSCLWQVPVLARHLGWELFNMFLGTGNLLIFFCVVVWRQHLTLVQADLKQNK